ncbi:MAG: hypothetical protein EOO68_23655 [Moraxellaceae bacterium]|nr:MAG: hypothetical protein EOO68_23655 [Moraxellaceae bacterium]
MHYPPTHYLSTYDPSMLRKPARQLILITSVLLMLGACSKNPNQAESSSASADVQSLATMPASESSRESSPSSATPKICRAKGHSKAD